MAAVYNHNGLLKASISSATNGHRLGANEAPPAIISMFLGSQISDMLNDLVNNRDSRNLLKGKEGLSLDMAQIPELLIDNTDRNRTSPFAFTGNRFEFRAVGSSANCSSAMIALNAAVADQLFTFRKAIDDRVNNGQDLNDAIVDEVIELVKYSKDIHFDGNGYCDEWKEEAKRRGLDCETSVPLIFDSYLKPESIEMFARTKVLSKVELEARNEVKWEVYTKKIQIEARVLGDMAINHVLPVATRYQSMLLDNVYKIKTLFSEDKFKDIAEQDCVTIEKIAYHTKEVRKTVDIMVEARRKANKIECERSKAIAYHDEVLPCMDIIRYHIDKLELMIDDEMWSIPKYRELLFIR
jgi:glutamine synthetase